MGRYFYWEVSEDGGHFPAWVCSQQEAGKPVGSRLCGSPLEALVSGIGWRMVMCFFDAFWLGSSLVCGELFLTLRLYPLYLAPRVALGLSVCACLFAPHWRNGLWVVTRSSLRASGLSLRVFVFLSVPTPLWCLYTDGCFCPSDSISCIQKEKEDGKSAFFK